MQNILTPVFNKSPRERLAEVASTFPFSDRQKVVFDHAAPKMPFAAIETLFQKYADVLPTAHPAGEFKYVDVPLWLWAKSRSIVDLDIDAAAPGMRILDLGCGGSHFGFLCHALGHKVVGLDIDVPVYI